jgi:protein SCO1/2
MSDLSRRKFLGLTATTPLAVAATAPLAALVPGVASGSLAGKTVSQAARARIQRLHLPNVPLITHEGKPVHFYDDLVRDKIVTMNFFFAKCEEVCPLVMANLVRVQKLLGHQVGRKVFMYSFALKPEEDDVHVIRHYREMIGARPGWTFLTGKLEHIETLRKAIGFSYPQPSIDRDKTQHIGNVRYGNEPLMLWGACPGMAHASFVAESINWVIRPETNGIPTPRA